MRWYNERGRTNVTCPESQQPVEIDELIFNVGMQMPLKEWRGTETNTIRIFLASSKELEFERKSFEIFIYRESKRLIEEGIFLHLEIWEDFLDAMSPTSLQDEYNKAVKASDIFVGLFFSKAGKYTQEEFETAHKHFKQNGTPHIFTFIKNSAIMSGEINEDFNSLLNFKNKLHTLGHFPTEFKDSNDLEKQFRNQFDKLKGKLY